jgi:hypothetical protein
VDILDNGVRVHHVKATEESFRYPVDFGLGGIELPQHFKPPGQAGSGGRKKIVSNSENHSQRE